MKFKTIFISNFFLLLTTLILLSSCADNDYDLSDIDMSISAGGKELVIPASSTKVIALKDLLDIKKDDIVQPDANGNYVLSKKGDGIKCPEITIEEVTIKSPSIKSSAKGINIPTLPPIDFKLAVELPSLKSTFETTKEDMPEELLELTCIKTNAIVTVKIGVEGLSGNTLSSSTKGVTIKFPPYFKSSQLTNGVFNVPDNINLLKGYSTAIQISKIEGFNIEYQDESKLQYAAQNFIASGDIALKGTIELTGNGTHDSVSNSKLTLDVYMSDIEIKEVSGIINPKIDIENQDISITDLPDFLEDDDVVFDINNPQINLILDNNSPLNATLNGKLIAMRNGKETASVNISYTLLANKNNKVCFSSKGQGGAIGYDNVAIPNLRQLIKTIPDRIILQSKIKATTDIVTFKLGNTYTVVPSYSLDVPLAFGPDLNIIYKENCSGWNKELEDFEVNEATVSMTAVNQTPLSLHIKAIAVDKDGKELSDVVVKVENDEIINSLESNNISISMNCPKGKMKLVDGLLLRITATSPKDSGTKSYNLNENQTVQFQNIKVKVTGGITADLN